eukprot:scaffold5517_cov135-Cylindrotheca_fusiformis.AAC.24
MVQQGWKNVDGSSVAVISDYGATKMVAKPTLIYVFFEIVVDLGGLDRINRAKYGDCRSYVVVSLRHVRDIWESLD